MLYSDVFTPSPPTAAFEVNIRPYASMCSYTGVDHS